MIFIDNLPLGCVIATAELAGCHEIVTTRVDWSDTEIRDAWLDSELKPHFPLKRELLFGDWISGNFAWEIANVKMLDAPIPAKGKQRLWEWEGSTCLEPAQINIFGAETKSQTFGNLSNSTGLKLSAAQSENFEKDVEKEIMALLKKSLEAVEERKNE